MSEQEVPEDQQPDSERIREMFDDLVKRGIIVEDREAPNCTGCAQPLETIRVRLVLTTGDEPVEVDVQEFRWAKGMHMFMASPGFFRFVSEGWAEFDASCASCGAGGVELEIVEQPHGLRFGAATRMAGRL